MSSLDSSNPNIILTGVLLAASITAVIAFTADRLVVFDIVGPTVPPTGTTEIPAAVPLVQLGNAGRKRQLCNSAYPPDPSFL